MILFVFLLHQTDSPAANKIKSKAWEKPKKMSKAKKAKNKKQSEQAKKKAAIKAIKEKADGDNKNHVDGNNKALEEVGEQRVKGEGSGDSGSESDEEQEEVQVKQNNSRCVDLVLEWWIKLNIAISVAIIRLMIERTCVQSIYAQDNYTLDSRQHFYQI